MTAGPRLKQRGPDKPYRNAMQWQALRRAAELTRIYKDQYPKGLPHNKVGVTYARYMVRMLAFFESIDRREQWLDRYTPWLVGKEARSRILNMAPHWYSAKSLGQHLELYDEDRERLKAWTIAAVDVSDEQRKVINLEKNKQAQMRRRRATGAVPREEYLAEHNKSRAAPWRALGMSRANYYRLGLQLDRSVTALSSSYKEVTHLSN
jgi:hypothetical protein